MAGGKASEFTPEEMVAHIKTDVVGAQVAAKHVIPGMRERGSGAVLFTGGLFGVHPNACADFACMSMDKSALRALALMLNAGLKGTGVFAGIVNIMGVVGSEERLAPANIAEAYWRLYADRAGFEICYPPSAVMRCYDWATGMRGGGREAAALSCGYAGRETLPDGSAGRLALPCVVGGFQSALERDVLKLLQPEGGPPIVMVLARGMWRSVPAEYREAIDEGRMLVVSPFPQGVVRVSKETAEKRNGWILDRCDEAVFASLDPVGSLARLVAARPNLRFRVL